MSESGIDSTTDFDQQKLGQILEAALLAAGEPLNTTQLAALFPEKQRPSPADLSAALTELREACNGRGVELTEVASGFRMQVRQDLNPWVSRLWEDRPRAYSRALLETLALIAYRQPITRGEIEEVRGVSISTNIVRTLQEREWIQVVGHRDVPGKPALFGTTRSFLDYFNLRSLDELPTLAEIRDLENMEPELDLEPPPRSPDGVEIETAEEDVVVEMEQDEEMNDAADDDSDADLDSEGAQDEAPEVHLEIVKDPDPQ